MRSIEVKAGESRRIIRTFSNSLTTSYRFSAKPMIAGQTVTGTVEVRGSNWVFPKPAAAQPLDAENQVAKGMWDTLFSVTVIPDQDVTIELERPMLRNVGTYMLIVAVILTVAIAAFSIARQ